jgi:DNA-binding XRE family transcriptional regulator
LKEKDMNQPQIIKTAGGEELVVLARADYEALLAAADDALEDAADIAMYDKCKSEMLADGDDAFLPPDVSLMMLQGDGLLKALRRSRGLSQAELASKAGIAQGYLSDMENKHKTGSPETLERLAAALEMPLKWLPGTP